MLENPDPDSGGSPSPAPTPAPTPSTPPVASSGPNYILIGGIVLAIIIALIVFG